MRDAVSEGDHRDQRRRSSGTGDDGGPRGARRCSPSMTAPRVRAPSLAAVPWLGCFRPGRFDRVNAYVAGIDLVDIPPGRATLSDRRTQRSWSVEVGPYRLGAVPVTRSQYAQVTGCRPDGSPGDRLPADSISWNEAVLFCNALSEHDGLTPAYRVGADGEVTRVTSAGGYRLPTEAEWEHACRAGTTGPRYGRLDDIARYRENSDDRLPEVRTRRPNAWGLYDMLGTVWEWCWDLYDPEVYGSYRVLRGGGWFDEHWSCRASVRRRSHPTVRLDDIGFRVARSAS